MKELFRLTLHPTESGLAIYTHKWIAIHETPCFFFCIPEWDKGSYSDVFLQDGETKLQSAKRRNKRLKRIHKTNSRFAFDSISKAYDHLKLLKRKQVQHMQRELEFVKAFLSKTKETPLSELPLEFGLPVIPNTGELVKQYLVFD